MKISHDVWCESSFLQLVFSPVERRDEPETCGAGRCWPPMGAACVQLLLAATLWVTPHMAATLWVRPHMAATLWVRPHMGAAAAAEPLNTTRASDFRMPTGAAGRRKRALSSREINALLDYHNRVRSQLWDEGLAESAASWASRCVWDHGPTHVMRHMGQNLSVTSGRCSGSVCSHYTQMVWASTNRVGCAVRKCSHMSVFGSTWREATLLVCNYSIKGNWVGEAPYKSGKPCSDCPSSYGGACWRNQCSHNRKPKRLSRN
ncbi:hypothetical protein FQN60_002404 [Etheostoma spectabile]|uniref:SCP domain-containing protein n=1 Tax=Etheostoma spectabile TaxID=54343 RepID=A0A5J5DDX3_9PERO|nr:hypothetical protein FQN60_002404 [Etheostoma spectabile]